MGLNNYRNEAEELYKEIDKTLDYYNINTEAFIQNTLEVEFEERRNMLLKYLNPGAHILDLGCGSGRDSKAFIDKGYKVTALDGSSELCKFASDYIGQVVIYKRFQDLDYVDLFDGVWACASMLHIPYASLGSVIHNISSALKSGGYFYTSFKYGEYEGDRNGRYFTDLNEERLCALLEPFTEFEVIEISVTEDVRPGHKGEKWLNGILRKTK